MLCLYLTMIASIHALRELSRNLSKALGAAFLQNLRTAQASHENVLIELIHFSILQRSLASLSIRTDQHSLSTAVHGFFESGFRTRGDLDLLLHMLTVTLSEEPPWHTDIGDFEIWDLVEYLTREPAKFPSVRNRRHQAQAAPL